MLKKLLSILFCLSLLSPLVAQQKDLSFYIDQAINSSPLLKDYKYKTLSNAQDSLLVKAVRKPQVTAAGQILIAPYNDNFGYDEAISNGQNYIAVAGVTQTMFNRNHMLNSFENLNLQNKTISNDAKLTEQELKKNITDKYITAFIAYSEFLAGKEVLALLREEDELLKLLAEKGIYKQSEYLSFLIEEQTQETSILQQQIDYKQDLYELNVLCGISDTVTYILSDPDIKQFKAASIENSPVYQQFKVDSLMILNSQQAVKLNYGPAVSWFADAGVSSTELLKTYKHFGFSFGVNFTMPIYDGKQRDKEINKLKIKDESRKSYQDFFKNQYSAKRLQIAQKIQSYDQLEISLRKQLGNINTLIEMNKLQLNNGELSISDYLLTIKNYIETKHQLNLMQLEKSQMINELNYISF
jgi:outer membrane protein TolC